MTSGEGALKTKKPPELPAAIDTSSVDKITIIGTYMSSTFFRGRGG
jgi:hypothetical protein